MWVSPVKNESFICEILAIDEELDPVANVRQRFADLADANKVHDVNRYIYSTTVRGRAVGREHAGGINR